MIYLVIYLVVRCNLTWEVGELALITDYWNEVQLKKNILLPISLPVTMEFWSTFISNDSYKKYNSWYIGVIIVYPKIYTSLNTKIQKKKGKKYYEKIKTRKGWNPLSHRIHKEEGSKLAL